MVSPSSCNRIKQEQLIGAKVYTGVCFPMRAGMAVRAFMTVGSVSISHVHAEGLLCVIVLASFMM